MRGRWRTARLARPRRRRRRRKRASRRQLRQRGRRCGSGRRNVCHTLAACAPCARRSQRPTPNRAQTNRLRHPGQRRADDSARKPASDGERRLRPDDDRRLHPARGEPEHAQFASNAQIMIQLRGTGSPTSTARHLLPGQRRHGPCLLQLPTAVWLRGLDAKNNWIKGDFIGTNAAGTFGFGSRRPHLEAIGVEFDAQREQQSHRRSDARRAAMSSPETPATASPVTDGSSNSSTTTSSACRQGDRRCRTSSTGPTGTPSARTTSSAAPARCSATSSRATASPARRTAEAGVEVSHGPGTPGQKIIGNCFGTDVSCTTSFSWTTNAFWGIHLEDTASNVSSTATSSSRARTGDQVRGPEHDRRQGQQQFRRRDPDGRPFPNSSSASSSRTAQAET